MKSYAAYARSTCYSAFHESCCSGILNRLERKGRLAQRMDRFQHPALDDVYAVFGEIEDIEK